MTPDELHATMQAEFKQVRQEIQEIKKEIKKEIKEEGKTTRRHFDIMVEKVNDSVKIVAEGTAHNTTRLENHERRLTTIEKARRS